MKITYSPETKDYIHFNLYQIQHSKQTVQRLKIQRIAVFIIFVVLAFVTYNLVNNFRLLATIIVFGIGAFWYWNFPKFIKNRVIRSTEKTIQSGRLEKLFDEMELVFTDEGVTETSTKGRQVNPWADIQSIALTDEAIYFFLANTRAILLPNRVLVADELNQLTSLINTNYESSKITRAN